MSMPYIIEVTVKSQEGKCVFGHEVGDRIVFDGKSVKGDICYSALMVILPKVFAMRYGVEFPWAEDNGTISNVCPDPRNPVVFEIRQAE
ncbi:MAG: TIGR04076 family protein [Promethearchaeota archaeon]